MDAGAGATTLLLGLCRAGPSSVWRHHLAPFFDGTINVCTYDCMTITPKVILAPSTRSNAMTIVGGNVRQKKRKKRCSLACSSLSPSLTPSRHKNRNLTPFLILSASRIICLPRRVPSLPASRCQFVLSRVHSLWHVLLQLLSSETLRAGDDGVALDSPDALVADAAHAALEALLAVRPAAATAASATATAREVPRPQHLGQLGLFVRYDALRARYAPGGALQPRWLLRRDAVTAELAATPSPAAAAAAAASQQDAADADRALVILAAFQRRGSSDAWAMQLLGDCLSKQL
eukprot:358988-Chlamydomonas_euryale.AAC.2